MDAAQFDSLARSITAVRSRRGLTRIMFGLAFGSAALASPLVGAAKKKCPPCKKRKQGKCKKKPNGTACSGGTCRGGRCILAPTCRDGIKNGTETGVDCGGPCPRCPNGQGCASRNDCASALCSGGTCQACTESPETCGDVNGAPCFCIGELSVCSNGVTSGPVSECEACPPNSVCTQEGTKRFCAERCGAA